MCQSPPVSAFPSLTEQHLRYNWHNISWTELKRINLLQRPQEQCTFKEFINGKMKICDTVKIIKVWNKQKSMLKYLKEK